MAKQSRTTERDSYAEKKEWFHFVCFKCSLSLTHSKIGGSKNIPLTEDGPITKDISWGSKMATQPSFKNRHHFKTTNSPDSYLTRPEIICM